MGVFGPQDSSQDRKLEADISFIKSRLDLLAKQISGSGQSGQAVSGTDADLDRKLRAIYEAVRAIRVPQPAHSSQSAPAGHVHVEGLDEIRADIKQLLSKSDRSMHLDLTQRLDRVDERLSAQQQTIGQLKDAVRELIAALNNR